MKKSVLSRSDWFNFFRDLGLPIEIVRQYEKYVDVLFDSKVPVIFEIEHLSELLQLNRAVLAKMINSPENFYREFSIPKRSGGKRLIQAPYPSLKACQDWIHYEILRSVKLHGSCHGFTFGRSILTNAEAHLNCTHLLKMDLKDFFQSIPFEWVMRLFRDFGYAVNVSFYLASLCCVNGGLCQGAPTSPLLSNILLRGLDKRLHSLSKKYKLKYTRYADDLSFSGDHIPVHFSSIVDEIIQDYGLLVNQDKTKLIRSNSQKIVTGISVSSSKLKLPRKYKRNLKQEMFYINKYGVYSHLNRRKIKDPNYIDSLKGKLAFWLQVEPSDQFALDATAKLKAIL